MLDHLWMRHKGEVLSLWMRQHVLTGSIGSIYILKRRNSSHTTRRIYRIHIRIGRSIFTMEWWTTKCRVNIELWNWAVIATNKHTGTLSWIGYYWAVLWHNIGYYGKHRTRT